MTTILLAAIVLLLAMILMVLVNHLPEGVRYALTWRAEIIVLWFGFGVSVVSFGLGMLLARIAVSDNSAQTGRVGAVLILAGLAGGWWPASRLDHALLRVIRVAEYLIAGFLAVQLFRAKLQPADIGLAAVYAGLIILAYWSLSNAFGAVFSLSCRVGDGFVYEFPNSGVAVRAHRTRTPGLIVVPFPGRKSWFYIAHEASGMPVSPQGKAMRKWQALLAARMLKSVVSDWTGSAKEVGICRPLPVEIPAKKSREYERLQYTSPDGRVVTAYRTRTPGLILTPDATCEGKYFVTHEASGLPVSDRAKPTGKWLAFRLARLFGDFPVDWTLPAELLGGYVKNPEEKSRAENNQSLTTTEEEQKADRRTWKWDGLQCPQGHAIQGPQK
jgi:hypothetical protein